MIKWYSKIYVLNRLRNKNMKKIMDPKQMNIELNGNIKKKKRELDIENARI